MSDPNDCPWCGCRAELNQQQNWGGDYCGWNVRCSSPGCEASGPNAETESAAASAWNRCRVLPDLRTMTDDEAERMP